MPSLAAALYALIKAVPAAERIFADVLRLYAAGKIDRNNAAHAAKDARNSAAVDAARGDAVAGGVLCASCPFADDGGGQHGPPPATPAVPGSGPGGT